MTQKVLFKRVTNKEEARAFLQNAIEVLGPGFHPDTPAREYIHVRTKKRTFKDAKSCNAYDINMIGAFFYFGQDVYKIALKYYENRFGK